MRVSTTMVDECDGCSSGLNSTTAFPTCSGGAPTACVHVCGGRYVRDKNYLKDTI